MIADKGQDGEKRVRSFLLFYKFKAGVTVVGRVPCDRIGAGLPFFEQCIAILRQKFYICKMNHSVLRIRT